MKPDRQFFLVDARQPGDISTLSPDLYHGAVFFHIVGEIRENSIRSARGNKSFLGVNKSKSSVSRERRRFKNSLWR